MNMAGVVLSPKAPTETPLDAKPATMEEERIGEDRRGSAPTETDRVSVGVVYLLESQSANEDAMWYIITGVRVIFSSGTMSKVIPLTSDPFCTF